MKFFNSLTRRRIARALIVTLLIVAANGAWSCQTGDNKDTLRSVARALHRAANATARADEVTHRFFLDGVIDAEEAEEISIVLHDINTAAFEFQKKARAYEVFDGAAQSDILRLASDTRDLINARIADGTARIKNERARTEWRAVVNASYDAFASIVLLVRAAKPAPTPAPVK